MELAEQFGVHLDEAPSETPGSIGTVERYYTPLLRVANERIGADTDRKTSD